MAGTVETWDSLQIRADRFGLSVIRDGRTSRWKIWPDVSGLHHWFEGGNIYQGKGKSELVTFLDGYLLGRRGKFHPATSSWGTIE